MRKLPRVDFDVQGRDNKGDELLDVVIVAQDDGGLRDSGKIGELGFDLAQFDAKTADLHLIVDPAAKRDLAIARRSPRHRPTGTGPDRRQGRNKDWR